MSDYFGKEIPKLGFGLIRLPKKLMGTDIEQTKLMVDRFMNAGFTYFDTAFVYLWSEEAAKKALVERYQRESYTLATKLNVFMMAPNEKRRKISFIQALNARGQAISTTICSMRLWTTITQNTTNSTYGILLRSKMKRDLSSITDFHFTVVPNCLKSC